MMESTSEIINREIKIDYTKWQRDYFDAKTPTEISEEAVRYEKTIHLQGMPSGFEAPFNKRPEEQSSGRFLLRCKLRDCGIGKVSTRRDLAVII